MKDNEWKKRIADAVDKNPPSEETLNFNPGIKSDYDLIQEDDIFNFIDLDKFQEGKPLTILLTHKDKTTDQIVCKHSYNQTQIEWFVAGSALNLIRSQQSK